MVEFIQTDPAYNLVNAVIDTSMHQTLCFGVWLRSLYLKEGPSCWENLMGEKEPFPDPAL